MEAVLQDLLLERLASDRTPDAVADLILAGCQGEDELRRAAGGEAVARPKAAPHQAGVEPAGAYLRSITVEGFRGIGPPSTLGLSPGPGLTLVVGRNGSGKSSFAEGLELLLTGDSHRWRDRSSVWAEGWRNLHHPRAAISASLAVEGVPGTTEISAHWVGGAGLHDARRQVDRPDGQSPGLASLGWERALELYRPFLSYNDLGSTFDKDINLFDALAPILGLEELAALEKMLASLRLELERASKDVVASKSRLLSSLADVDDERARAAAEHLGAGKVDLAALAGLATAATDEVDTGGRRAVLRQLAAVTAPDVEATRAAAAELEATAEAAMKIEDTDAGHARQLIRLLGEALDHQARRAGVSDCPVCGSVGALTPEWREQTERHLARLRSQAEHAERLHRALTENERKLRGLVQAPPAILSKAAEVGIDASQVRRAWSAWAAGLDVVEPIELTYHVAAGLEDLTAAVESMTEAAAAAYEELEDRWKPVAIRLASWIEDARDAESKTDAVKRLKAAEQWLKATMVELSTQRFDPVADRARELWGLLRQQSNVDLGRVQLEGTKKSPKRRVALDVTVDGVRGAAVGVMSQGELHALALSLFLPRATMAESPFRFMVIDDPVQAMDPARVDGLARVLDDVAATRQVVVFTHDDRLPAAVRGLGIPATVVEVTRRDRSVVELRPGLTPARRALEDAFALAKTEELPPKVAGRVVPGMCRIAIEAACTETVRRRRIGRGEPHADVERLLLDSTKLGRRMALALFDDAGRIQEVHEELKRRFGLSKVEAYQRANKGAHHGDAGDVLGLVRNCEALVAGVLELR